MNKYSETYDVKPVLLSSLPAGHTAWQWLDLTEVPADAVGLMLKRKSVKLFCSITVGRTAERSVAQQIVVYPLHFTQKIKLPCGVLNNRDNLKLVLHQEVGTSNNCHAELGAF